MSNSINEVATILKKRITALYLKPHNEEEVIIYGQTALRFDTGSTVKAAECAEDMCKSLAKIGFIMTDGGMARWERTDGMKVILHLAQEYNHPMPDMNSIPFFRLTLKVTIREN